MGKITTYTCPLNKSKCTFFFRKISYYYTLKFSSITWGPYCYILLEGLNKYQNGVMNFMLVYWVKLGRNPNNLGPNKFLLAQNHSLNEKLNFIDSMESTPAKRSNVCLYINYFTLYKCNNLLEERLSSSPQLDWHTSV